MSAITDFFGGFPVSDLDGASTGTCGSSATPNMRAGQEVLWKTEAQLSPLLGLPYLIEVVVLELHHDTHLA
jgi:hypothetical protein